MELHTDVLVKKEADTFAPNRAHLASLMPYIYGLQLNEEMPRNERFGHLGCS